MKRLFRFLPLLALCLLQEIASAQININIRVLPPYQSRISEYASRPDLVLLTLTNTGTVAQQVQLTGSITGDNGMAAWVKAGYRSPQPIELAPGQAINLNGNDIAFLFDHNQLEYTGVSRIDFTRGVGLLEGTYQLCIRALDYDTHAPLSPEEPMGCTQLIISNVEPPTIIMPFNEQEVNNRGIQAFPISWSTPPGASPLTQYKVKMVEMIAPRNPNDALLSATTPPFFEETVNFNTLLYGPAHPQLTPGRQYALMVQAIDPYNTISFRNQGMSEVITFTYGELPQIALTDSLPAKAIAYMPSCNCSLTELPIGNNENQRVRVNSEIQVNHFKMNVASLFSQKGKGGLSGTGTILLPINGKDVPFVRLKVQFEDMLVTLNRSMQLQMIGGEVKGTIAGDAPHLELLADTAAGRLAAVNDSIVNAFDSYFASHKNKTLSALQASASTTGLELPLSMDLGPNPIAMTNATFTSTQSWFDAVGIISAKEVDADTRIGFSGKGICMEPQDICGEGELLLAQDIPLANTGFTLLGGTNGSQVFFGTDGIEQRVELKYEGHQLLARKDTTRIRGRLMYHFADDPSGQIYPIANERVYLKKVFTQQTMDKDGLVSNRVLSPSQSALLSPQASALDGVAVETDADGYFTLTYAMSPLDSAGVIPTEKWDWFAEGEGTQRNPSLYGDMLGNMQGQMAMYYQLETTNPHYKPHTELLSITPGGTRDLTNVLLNANSFSLSVNVQEVFNQLKGNYVPGAKIRIYRDLADKEDSTLRIPRYEGDLLDDAAIDNAKQEGKILIAERLTPSPSKESNPEAYRVNFERLFKGLDSDPYHYRISLENGSHVLVEASFDYISGTLKLTQETANKQQTTVAKPSVSTSSTLSSSVLSSSVNASGLRSLLGKVNTTANAGTSSGSAGVGKSTSYMQVKDKWMVYHYNSKPDTALLTIEKELVSPPRSKVTGTLQYTYKTDRSVPATPYAHMPVKLMVMYLIEKDKQPTRPTNSGASNTLATSVNFYSNAAALFANRDIPSNLIATTTAINNTMVQAINNNNVTASTSTRTQGAVWVNDKQVEDNYKVLQTVYTDSEGRFTFDFPSADFTGEKLNGSDVLYSGDLTNSTSGKVTRVYRIVPDVKYYCAPDEDIIVQPWGETDCGILTSYVQTFNLELHVQKINKLDKPDVVEAFPNVPINLYRVANSPMRKFWPVVQGIDINKEKSLFYATATPSTPFGSNVLAGTNNTAAVSTAAKATQISSTTAAAISFTANYNATFSGASIALNTSNLSATPANSASLSLQSTAPSYTVTGISSTTATALASFNSYVHLRQGASANAGKVTFSNLVKSLGDEEDILLLEADNVDREGYVAFKKAYLEFPETRNVVTKDEVDNPAFGPTNIGKIRTDDIYPTFNSDFDPNQTQIAYLRVLPEPTVVRGRVTDNGTTLGIAGVQLKLRVVIDNRLIQETTTTDENGYYNFTSISAWLKTLTPDRFPLMTNSYGGKSTYTLLEVIFAPGYERPPLEELEALTTGLTGKQIPRNFALMPLGKNAFGYVVDAGDPSIGVTARVKLKVNGRWVDTKPYSGKRDEPTKKSNYLQHAGLLDRGLSTTIQTSVQAAAQSNNQSSSIALGTFGTLSTTLTANKPTSTLTISSAAAASHPMFSVAMSQSAGEGSNLVVKRQDLQQTAIVSPVLANRLLDHVNNLQRFDIDLPARPDSIVILPYDPAYIADTVAVNVKGADEYLGEFGLRRRKHKLHIWVKTADGTVVKGAKVQIDGAEGNNPQYTDAKGIASFEFVNNSTSNFTVWVTNRDTLSIQGASGNQDILIVPKSINIGSEDDLALRTKEVTVERAAVLAGKVLFEKDESPVEGALVYVDQGMGSNSEMKAITRSDGTYLLPVPQQNTAAIRIDIVCSYSAPGKTYVGSSASYPSTGKTRESSFDFTIREVEEIDISKLYGFPVKLSKLVAEKGQYRITGELHTLADNENFALRSELAEGKSLAFDDLVVKASSLLNPNGVPVAVPIDEKVTFINKEINIRAFRVFKARLSAANSGPLSVKRASADTTGMLLGQVRIVDNSFNFPTSYMTISNQDFFLGNYGQQQASAKLDIPVFRTDEAYPLTRFSITSKEGSPIAFKYLGFDGRSETSGDRESYVMGDSVNLFMNLTAKIQGGIKLDLKAGKAVIRHDRMEPIVTDNGINFKLEDWEVRSNSWELSNSSGGIVLQDNVLYTGKADIKLSKISIIPGELVFHDLNSGDDAKELENNLTVGGKANVKLHLYHNTEIVFAYDPDVGRVPGKGHFKFTLRNDNGKAAYIKGLEGMTRSSDRIVIQYMSLLSNSEELFGFEANAAAVTYQNQLSFRPKSIYSHFDRLILSGTTSIHVPNVADNLSAQIAYWPTEGQGNKLVISPLEFSFVGNGGTKFRSLTSEGAQVFEARGLGIAGEINLPGQLETLKANMVSMVTEAAGKAAEEAKKQAEVFIGGYKEEAKEMLTSQVDEVLSDPELAKIREDVEKTLNQAQNTYNQALAIGQAGQQYMKDLAAKWRLAGEGLGAINNFSNDPVGSLMQLNGVMEGFTGVNIVDSAKQKAKMVAMEAIKGWQEELPVEGIADGLPGNAGGLSGMKFDFDFATGRVFGTLSMAQLDFGAVGLTKLGIEMLFDNRGWYLYTGATVNLRAVPLIFPVAVGMCIGSYPEISPALEARITEQSYVKKLPSTYKTNGIKGFFLTGRKDLIEEIDYGFNAFVFSFQVKAMAGLDARLYANFGNNEQQIGLGAMVFARAFASVSVLGCGAEGGAEANLGVKAMFTNSAQGISFNAKACASARITGRVKCLFVDEGFDLGFIGMLGLCVGECQKTLDFSLDFSSTSCAESNAFDY